MAAAVAVAFAAKKIAKTAVALTTLVPRMVIITAVFWGLIAGMLITAAVAGVMIALRAAIHDVQGFWRWVDIFCNMGVIAVAFAVLVGVKFGTFVFRVVLKKAGWVIKSTVGV